MSARPICGAPVRLMRDTCKLSKGHRGMHSMRAFTCDTCGNVRRGSPVAADHEGNVCCFFCVREARKDGYMDPGE